VGGEFHASSGTHDGVRVPDGMQMEVDKEACGVSWMDTERRKNGEKGGEECTKGADDDGVRGDDPLTSSSGDKSR